MVVKEEVPIYTEVFYYRTGVVQDVPTCMQAAVVELKVICRRTNVVESTDQEVLAYMEVDLVVILVGDNDENVNGVDDSNVLADSNDDDEVYVNLEHDDGDGVMLNVMKWIELAAKLFALVDE